MSATDTPTYTAGDLEAAIHLALKARDFPAVAGLMRRLAVVDPHRAQAVLDLVELARTVTR